MTVGKQLWLLILVKVLILFGVLKLFFFPDILEREYESDSERATAVRSILTSRGSAPETPLD